MMISGFGSEYSGSYAACHFIINPASCEITKFTRSSKVKNYYQLCYMIRIHSWIFVTSEESSDGVKALSPSMITDLGTDLNHFMITSIKDY